MSGFYSSDLPQDLSAKFKTVGVQTEDNKSSLEALQDVLIGLSEKQTRILLGVITSVLFKTDQNPNQYENTITELHQYRQRFGWTSLEPETPPISPPQQNLLRSPAPAASKPSLSVTPIHQSYFARKLEDLHHPQPGCSIVKCEEETKNIQSSICMEDESVEGSMSSMSRDEKLVMEMQIPFTVEEIIHKPMEEFNDILSKHSVSEDIINICRDIRRRGKNKIAAQNCRKRKVDQIFSLEDDLSMIRNRKKIILSERAELLRQEQEVRGALFSLQRKILLAVGKSEEHWKLSVDENNGHVAFVEFAN